MPKRSRDSTDGSTTPEGSVTDAVDFTAPIGAALTSASARAALAALSADDQAAVLQVLASASTFDVAALAAACVPHAVVPAVVAARVVAPHLPQSALPAATTAQLAQLLPFLWQVAIKPTDMASRARTDPFPCPSSGGAPPGRGMNDGDAQRPFIREVPRAITALLRVAFTTASVKSLRAHVESSSEAVALRDHIDATGFAKCSLESLQFVLDEDFDADVDGSGAPDDGRLAVEFLLKAVISSPLRRQLKHLGTVLCYYPHTGGPVRCYPPLPELRALAVDAAARDCAIPTALGLGYAVPSAEEAAASPFAALFPVLEALVLYGVLFPGVVDSDDDDGSDPGDGEARCEASAGSIGAAPPRLCTVALTSMTESGPLPFTAGLEQVTALWAFDPSPDLLRQCPNVCSLVLDGDPLYGQEKGFLPPRLERLWLESASTSDVQIALSITPPALRGLHLGRNSIVDVAQISDAAAEHLGSGAHRALQTVSLPRSLPTLAQRCPLLSVHTVLTQDEDWVFDWCASV